MSDRKLQVVMVIFWVLLALGTLYFILRQGDFITVVAALFAWTGGLLTYALADGLSRSSRKSSDRP